MRDLYQEIIKSIYSMQDISTEVQKQIDECRKILYELDEEGNILGKSKLYRNYLENAEKYAQAKAKIKEPRAAALANSTMIDQFSGTPALFQYELDDALDRLKTAGADQVEQALETLKSVGVSCLVRHNLYPLRRLE